MSTTIKYPAGQPDLGDFTPVYYGGCRPLFQHECKCPRCQLVFKPPITGEGIACPSCTYTVHYIEVEPLHYWPYCPDCKHAFEFDRNEPFAYCACGATEWGDPRPAPWVPDPHQPINMVLHCPKCKTQHVDAPEPDQGWDNPPHKSHKCAACGCIWRPAEVATNGVLSVDSRGKADDWPTPAWE